MYCCCALIVSQSGGAERSQLLNSAAITAVPLSRERAVLGNLFRAARYFRGKVGAAVCLANVVWKFGPHASFMGLSELQHFTYTETHWIKRCWSYWL